MQDYFDFFDIARRFHIDKKALRLKYIQNSRKYHPDYFTMEGRDQQDEAMRLSTLNNEAYQTLSDDRKRMKHVLSLYDMFPEEGKAQVPQEFLMDMMDVNEQLMEAQMSEDEQTIDSVVTILDTKKESLQLMVDDAMTRWDKNQEITILTEIRDIYLKQQYLKRLQDRIVGIDPEI